MEIIVMIVVAAVIVGGLCYLNYCPLSRARRSRMPKEIADALDPYNRRNRDPVSPQEI